MNFSPMAMELYTEHPQTYFMGNNSAPLDIVDILNFEVLIGFHVKPHGKKGKLACTHKGKHGCQRIYLGNMSD